MAKTDVWFETPPFRDDYQLTMVDGEYLTEAVKPKQFLHIDQSECILCEGCVDICPWKCIHYLSIDAISEASNVDAVLGRGRLDLSVAGLLTFFFRDAQHAAGELRGCGELPVARFRVSSRNRDRQPAGAALDLLADLVLRRLQLHSAVGREQ